MKALILISLLAVSTTFADTPVCSSESDKIAELQARIAKLEAARKVVKKPVIVAVAPKACEVPPPAKAAKTVYVDRVKHVVIDKTKTKHHILSILALSQPTEVYAQNDDHDSHKAKAVVSTAYVPGLLYQYQFTDGLVLGAGASLGMDIKPVLNLGFEF
jgi:hypothetical protein